MTLITIDSDEALVAAHALRMNAVLWQHWARNDLADTELALAERLEHDALQTSLTKEQR